MNLLQTFPLRDIQIRTVIYKNNRSNNLKNNFLGNTGLKVSQCGMGILTMGKSQLNLSIQEGAELIYYAYSKGINFFDTAEYYETYEYLKEGLKLIKERVPKGHPPVISSKSLAADYNGMKNAIENALKELDLNVIDIFLMHEVRTGQFSLRDGALKALKEAKEIGQIKAIGLSTHHVDIVDNISTNPDIDLIFPLLNFKSMGIRKGILKQGKIIDHPASNIEMIEAIKKASSNGKGIFTMKALGGGNLTTDYQKALSFAFSQKEVSSVMLGFGKKSEIDDLISFLQGSMPPTFNPDISKKIVRVNQEDCEGCGTCLKHCASNAISFSKENGLAIIDPEKCITCGYCAYACPVRAIIMY